MSALSYEDGFDDGYKKGYDVAIAERNAKDEERNEGKSDE